MPLKRKRLTREYEYTSSYDSMTKNAKISGWINHFTSVDDAILCIRALLYRYEVISPRGEPDKTKHKQCVKQARRRVLEEDLTTNLPLHKEFRKIRLFQLENICGEFALRCGDSVDRVVVHKPRKKKSEWTQEFALITHMNNS